MNRKRKRSRLAQKDNVSQNVDYGNVGGKFGINYYVQTDVKEGMIENLFYFKQKATRVKSKKGPVNTVTH